MSRCSSCQSEIKWARSEKSGRMMPLDPHMVFGGNLILVDRDGTTPIVRVVEPSEDQMGYVTHFSTCPDASIHRRGK